MAVHHDKEEGKMGSIFTDDSLQFLRQLLKRHVSWTSYKKMDVKLTVVGEKEHERIKLELTELPVEQCDTFNVHTADWTLIMHCLQVLMMVPNELMGKVVCENGGQSDRNQMELDLDLSIVYGVLRTFFTLLDQESQYPWLHTPLLTFLIKACKALPNLRTELHKGINHQDWSIRSFDMTLVDALPAKKRKYRRRFGKLNGVPGGLIKDNLERLMTHHHYNFKSAVCQLLFTICEEDSDEFSYQFGVGNTIGFLSEMGLFGVGE